MQLLNLEKKCFDETKIFDFTKSVLFNKKKTIFNHKKKIKKFNGNLLKSLLNAEYQIFKTKNFSMNYYCVNLRRYRTYFNSKRNYNVIDFILVLNFIKFENLSPYHKLKEKFDKIYYIYIGQLFFDGILDFYKKKDENNLNRIIKSLLNIFKIIKKKKKDTIVKNNVLFILKKLLIAKKIICRHYFGNILKNNNKNRFRHFLYFKKLLNIYQGCDFFTNFIQIREDNIIKDDFYFYLSYRIGIICQINQREKNLLYIEVMTINKIEIFEYNLNNLFFIQDYLNLHCNKRILFSKNLYFTKNILFYHQKKKQINFKKFRTKISLLLNFNQENTVKCLEIEKKILKSQIKKEKIKCFINFLFFFYYEQKLLNIINFIISNNLNNKNKSNTLTIYYKKKIYLFNLLSLIQNMDFYFFNYNKLIILLLCFINFKKNNYNLLLFKKKIVRIDILKYRNSHEVIKLILLINLIKL